MTKLVVTRGLPGSGKTTAARSWVSYDRANRARVNRDDIRMMLDDGIFERGVTEARVIIVRNAVISSLLERGVSVICDDTNLPDQTVEDLKVLARDAGAHTTVEDLRNIPLATCIKRNAHRTDKKPVPVDAIREMHARYISE